MQSRPQILVVSRRKDGTPTPASYTVVACDRQSGSPLGNPHTMYAEWQRDEVCERFDRDFYAALAMREGPLYQAYVELLRRARAGERLALQCWCAPARCHADSIKRQLERDLAAGTFA